MITPLLKKGALIALVFLCFQSISYAQSSSKQLAPVLTQSATATSATSRPLIELENPVHNSLGYDACNAKSLYEQVFNVSLNEAEFKNKCASSITNRNEWMTVKNYFQGNNNVDLSLVEGMIQAIDAKL